MLLLLLVAELQIPRRVAVKERDFQPAGVRDEG